MTASTSESTQPPSGANNWARQLRRHRLAAALLVLAGALLLAANLNVLPPDVQRVVAGGWPALLILAGAGLLLAGWPQVAAGPGFALERSDYTAGELTLDAGTADLRLSALEGNAHLAEGQLPTPRGPALTTVETVARLKMTPRLAVPLLPGRAWAVALAPDLPWRMELRSSLGDFDLDLQALNLAALELHSTIGDVALTLPAEGQAEVGISLGLGNLTLRVPETMAVKVKVTRGRLATLKPEARRFVELAPGEWATPLYAVSTERCTLTVSLGTGDLTLV